MKIFIFSEAADSRVIPQERFIKYLLVAAWKAESFATTCTLSTKKLSLVRPVFTIWRPSSSGLKMTCLKDCPGFHNTGQDSNCIVGSQMLK